MSEPIEFLATIAKVQTLADGGIRLTLDLPETAVLQAAQLIQVYVSMAVVSAELTPEPKAMTREQASDYERIND